MSFLKVNSITGRNNNAPTFTTGVQILSSTDPIAISSITADTIRVTGVATASQFIGDGSQLTGLSGVTRAQTFALSVIN
jgi:hypothetical protein